MQTENDQEQKKEAMKRLRNERKDKIAAVSARVKEQKKAFKAIREILNKDGGMTVPELAEGTGMPASDILYYLATMKKYGDILEGAKDSGYFRYRLAEISHGEE